MSVYAKDRKTTKIQYVVTAQKLQVAVIQYLMHAIAFPNKIDHAVIETLGSEITFGRYMDDSYIIAKNKSTLIKALEIIKRFCEKLKNLIDEMLHGSAGRLKSKFDCIRPENLV